MPDNREKEANKQKERWNLHCTPFSYKCWIQFVFQIVKFLIKIPFWGTWLNVEPLTEWDPLTCKLWCLGEGFKSKHGSTIIGDKACHFVNWIIYSEDGQNCICSDKWWFFHRIYCTYKYVYISQLRWLPFFIIPEKKISRTCYLRMKNGTKPPKHKKHYSMLHKNRESYRHTDILNRHTGYLRDSRSRYVSRTIGDHFGNWSNIQVTANHISQITDVNHNPYASLTGCVILLWKKKPRITIRRRIIIRYGFILLEGIDNFLQSGCLPSSILRKEINNGYKPWFLLPWEENCR